MRDHKFLGLYKKKSSESSKEQYDWLYFYVNSDGYLITEGYNQDENKRKKLVYKAKSKNFSDKTGVVTTKNSLSSSQRVFTDQQQVSSHEGYGIKFGRQKSHYNSVHQFVEMNSQKHYLNNYHFENSESSVGKYVFFSDHKDFD